MNVQVFWDVIVPDVSEDSSARWWCYDDTSETITPRDAPKLTDDFSLCKMIHNLLLKFGLYSLLVQLWPPLQDPLTNLMHNLFLVYFVNLYVFQA